MLARELDYRKFAYLIPSWKCGYGDDKRRAEYSLQLLARNFWRITRMIRDTYVYDWIFFLSPKNTYLDFVQFLSLASPFEFFPDEAVRITGCLYALVLQSDPVGFLFHGAVQHEVVTWYGHHIALTVMKSFIFYERISR